TQHAEQLIQNSGNYQDQLESSVSIQNTSQIQKSKLQREDTHGFDEYDEEDFRRDNTYESHHCNVM
ncbi:hypothetical protein X798_07486, partial [Onchocerca flexuosa]